jgi:hypothetical protein
MGFMSNADASQRPHGSRGYLGRASSERAQSTEEMIGHPAATPPNVPITGFATCQGRQIVDGGSLGLPVIIQVGNDNS